MADTDERRDVYTTYMTVTGLFEHLEETFPSLGGYYTTLQVVTLLAYMALCRIKTVEQLQYETPGELGKLMGLDRVPEVHCLRKKLTRLSQPSLAELGQSFPIAQRQAATATGRVRRSRTSSRKRRAGNAQMGRMQKRIGGSG